MLAVAAEAKDKVGNIEGKITENTVNSMPCGIVDIAGSRTAGFHLVVELRVPVQEKNDL